MIPSLFIAASIRQACAVQRLQRAIRIAAPSVQIFDWTAAPGSQFFSFCADACMSADLVVCLGTGQESVIQAGMAYINILFVIMVKLKMNIKRKGVYYAFSRLNSSRNI